MCLDHHQYGMQNTQLSLTVCHDVAPAEKMTWKKQKQKKREKHKQECVWTITNKAYKIHSSI